VKAYDHNTAAGCRKVKPGLQPPVCAVSDSGAEVGAIHPKGMPMIFTKAEECEAWKPAPGEQAKVLQRPLSDGLLKIVRRGEKDDIIGVG